MRPDGAVERIEVFLDELVIDGADWSPGAQLRFERELAEELTRLAGQDSFRAGAPVEGSGRGTRVEQEPAMRGRPGHLVTVGRATAETAGVATARALYQALRQKDEANADNR